MKSVLETPESSAIELMVTLVVGTMPSVTSWALAANDPAAPGAARVRMALLPAASAMVLPLRVKALAES